MPTVRLLTLHLCLSCCRLGKAQEVVEKFSSKLKALRIIVRELTGDMQLTRAEAEAAHVSFAFPLIGQCHSSMNHSHTTPLRF